ncbi:uncharacterized protein F4807DRAFT_423773 [Annulohypoxylon truncatum]|uniref:uncharacterized protein n=1 Tax=Annulohypoxylon truncatum TaxID=327061 RepID=UPI00200748B6|nr:uncharacterized protein F4807DRAFT_423773 [Annulohypoxylon truncatum]KAI1210086.1 hypothetical protein F4807DRAFT_423773 [Annulohypoxylon truncatum]
MASSASLNDTAIEAIRRGPALEPPPGTEPNFIDPPNNNKLAVAVISVCSTLSILFYLARIYTRIFYMKKARLEDYIGLVALPFLVAGAAKFAAMTISSPGLFVRQWNMRVIDLEGFIYSYIVVTIQYCVTLALVKVAIILEWIHFFVPRATRNTFYWICYGMIVANCCLYLATVLCINYACTPREKIWRRYLPGTCINTVIFNVVITSIHLVFDILMLLVPHRIIWKLSLSSRQRIGISAIFSVGIMTCVCAAGRVASSVNMIYSTDLTYDYSGYLVWGLAECATAGLIFCVPAIPVLFRYRFQLPSIGLRFRDKMGTIFSQHPSTTSSQLPSRPKTNHRSAPPDVAPWIDVDSVANLTELEPVRTRSGEGNDQLQEEGFISHSEGGILRTTEIAITTSENPDIKSPHRRGPHQPWLDCDSSD